MAVNNALVQNKKMGIAAYLMQESVKKQINDVVGVQSGQRFSTAIISAVSVNPALQECTNGTIVSGALLGESLKLSPSPQLGHYYLVPFKDNKAGVTNAQFQLGYKGYIQLAIRSGFYKKLNVTAIKEGELVRFDPLNEEIEVNIIEDEDKREATPTIGYYAMFEYTNGFRKAIYWSKKKMEQHATTYSKGYAAKKGYTFWEKDFDGMAYKTMLRQLISKWGIMSIEMQQSINADMSVVKKNDDGFEFDYIDNPATPEPETPESPKNVASAATSPKVETPEDPADPAAALFGK